MARPIAAVRVRVGLITTGLVFPIAAHSSQTLFADSYMVLYSGRWIAEHGIPDHEPFTLEAVGQPWIDQQWLAHLVFFEAWSVAGYQGVGVIAAMLVATAFGILADLMRRGGTPPILAILCALSGALLVGQFLFIRAECFAYPLFAGIAWLCCADWPRDRFRAQVTLLVPLMLLWANLHGSAVVAAGLTCAYLVARAASRSLPANDRRSYAGLAAGIATTPVMTPYGLETLDYYESLLGNAVVQANISEWQPVTFSAFPSFFVVLALVTVSCALSMRVGRRPAAIPLVWALVMAAASFNALRNQPWFFMAASVVAGDTARSWLGLSAWPDSELRRLLAAVAIGVACAGLADIVVRDDGHFERLVSPRVLDGVIHYAATHEDAHILGDGASAGALLWRAPVLHGRIGFDPRLEQYSEARARHLFGFEIGVEPGVRALSRTYDVFVATTSVDVLTREVEREGSALRFLARDDKSAAAVRVDDGVH